MKPIHEFHYGDDCTFLGTVDNQDLNFSHQGGFGPTVIARYSSDGPDYCSGLCFSKEGVLRIAAERAIDRGLLTREQWRRAVYRYYIPYSEVKALMLMSIEELWKLVEQDVPLSIEIRSRKKNRLALDILTKKEESL